MTDALELEGVVKRYAGHEAVRDLTLSVPGGSIYGILGPNGAGKSTTLRMIMSILTRDAGRISLLGSDPETDRRVLRRVGYLPEERGLYRKMKVREVIVFFAGLKGVPGREAARRSASWLERMELGDWADARVDTLSKGMQQKVQFITTVLHEPEVLILDEPHAGLDPVNQQVLRDTIHDAARAGRTVLLSTHNMEQAEQLCEHVCIIAQGRKVLDGRLREIRRRNRGDRYRIEFDEAAPVAERFFREHRLLTRAEATGDAWEVELRAGTRPDELLAAIAGLGVAVSRFEHVQPSLREIFVQRVAGVQAAARRPEAVHV
jgi:ABC-2 type transport system ATP-binding protein